MRDGDWKAVFYHAKWELFNLAQDHNEAHDLSPQYPERLATMKRLHTDWLREATMTTTKEQKANSKK